MLTSSRIRALVLGLLAVMLAGSVTAGAASAEAGPFWSHKLAGEKEGKKIEPKAPENFEGKGGKQVLTSEPATGVFIELTSAATQVKGAIFNAEHQGQIKVVIFYQQPELKVNGVSEPECKVAIGQQSQFSDIVQLKGHLAWKWNGTKEQLEEQPQAHQNWDIVFTQTEPQEQPGRPLLDLRTGVGAFAELKFSSNKECPALLSGTIQKVGGSEVGIPSPSGLGEFNKKLNIRTIASGTLPEKILENKVEKLGFLQHIWVGNGYQPLILGLTFASNAANLSGQTETEVAQQEIAVTEK